jgi:hypothetical protein
MPAASIKKAMGNRIVFQMDQRQLENQELLRNERQCGEDANLDSSMLYLMVAILHKGPKAARKPSQHQTDMLLSTIRKKVFK